MIVLRTRFSVGERAKNPLHSGSFRKKLIAGGLLLFLHSELGHFLMGHEFWIELSSYHLPPGSLAGVALRVGEGFEGDPVVRERSRFESFLAIGPAGAVDLAGMEGHDPAGFVRPAEPGTYIIGYRGRPSRIDLEADRFESYLREKGLEGIIEKRASRGEKLALGREVYSRCAKAILVVGEGPPGGGGRILGLPLEIVPETDVPGAGPSPVRFRILYRGAPLAGALVGAIRRGDPDSRIEARSDGEGRVLLDMDRPGVWLVDTVHMIEADRNAGADWESLWASLTLERPPGSIGVPTSRRSSRSATCTSRRRRSRPGSRSLG